MAQPVTVPFPTHLPDERDGTVPDAYLRRLRRIPLSTFEYLNDQFTGLL